MSEIELPPRLVSEPGRVLMRGLLSTEVIYGVTTKSTPGIDQFNELFEVVEGPGGKWLAKTDYYQGLTVTAVIRRRTDGRLFGYEFWDDISNNGEAEIESNGGKHGFGDYTDYRDEWCLTHDGETDDLNEVYVWLPVEAFTMLGYRVPGASR